VIINNKKVPFMKRLLGWKELLGHHQFWVSCLNDLINHGIMFCLSSLIVDTQSPVIADEHLEANPSHSNVSGTTDKVVEGPIHIVDSTHPPEGHRNLVPVETVPVSQLHEKEEVHSPMAGNEDTTEEGSSSPNMLDKAKNKSKSFLSKMFHYFKGGQSQEGAQEGGTESGGGSSGTESKTIAINTDNSKITSTVTETPTSVTCTVTEHVTK
jgi:hypothetical protein